MLRGDVIGHLDQRQLDLQRRGAEQPRELGLGPDLVRHQVEQADPQGPDVLAHRVGFAHHHDAFGFESRAGGKVVRNLDRHRLNSRCRGRRRFRARPTKNPASRCASAGFKHPGLLASCLTWLASRPAQIDHDDGPQIMTLWTPRQVRTGAGRCANVFFDFSLMAPIETPIMADASPRPRLPTCAARSTASTRRCIAC